MEQECNLSKSYFLTKLPFPIVFEFKDVDIPVGIKPYKTFQGFDIHTGTPSLQTLYGLIDSVKDICQPLVSQNVYDCVIFAWNLDTVIQPLNGVITSFTSNTPLFENTEFTQLAVNSYLELQNKIWLIISHELMHAFCWKIKRLGINVVDEMDDTKVGNQIIPFFKNDFPLDPDSNFAHTFANLKPYYDKIISPKFYKPKDFTLKELVSSITFEKYGDKAWQFMDARMLRNLQFIRDNLGKVIVNTPLLQHRCFDAVEERKDGYSQHNHGRAVDFTVLGWTAEQVRQWITKNQERFPEPNMWIEIGTSWVHIDVRYSDKRGIYLFNP